jgi:YjbE family integral membrane protein
MNDMMAVGLEVLRIIWINILLSGDNAVVIALACRELHGREKSVGIVLGASLAVVLRIAFTAIVAQVLIVPYVKVVGGLVLLWIAVKLIAEEEEDQASVKGHATLWRAVGTVVVADIVMSLDNILAIAAAAHGSMTLIVIGLALSVPVVIGGSSLISALMAKLPLLAWAGAALLGWIAGDMVFSDPALAALVPTGLIHPAVYGAVSAAFVVVVGWYRMSRRAKSHSRRA